ncbi:cysteine and histidine-rich domain-containing protein 1 isoform X2 [Stigmatopora argus]
MVLLCYNKGCGQTFDADDNEDGSCLFHPGNPIFHDALKGWSCCRKRTTDFSEFLSIQGCTRGRHNGEKSCQPLLPGVSSEKADGQKSPSDVIYRGPKSSEKMRKERPSSDEPKTKLPFKVAASLMKELEKLNVRERAETEKKESQAVVQGTRCKNSGCKTVYMGLATESQICTHHPGGPVFHEGYKYWSCCCIRTADFNAFLDQKGCTAGKHRWIPKQDKKTVACRHDWHQTPDGVVVTIYAKNADPELSCVEANGAVVTCHVQFESDKIFKRDFHLWGAVHVQGSVVNVVQSKVEIALRKADRVTWGKLEDPDRKSEPESAEAEDDPEWRCPDWDDDDISDSDEEWAGDGAAAAPVKETRAEVEPEDVHDVKRKAVEQEVREAVEVKQRAEEERAELRRQQEEEDGDEEMPELE